MGVVFMAAGSSESEIKIILGEEENERLRGRLGEPVRRLRQINYFYETPEDHLARARTSLRVREETEVDTNEQRFLLTVKEAGLRAGALMVRPELESVIDRELWHSLKSGEMHFAEVDLPPIYRLRELVQDLAGLELAELGSIENVREVFDFRSRSLAMEILLDRTRFPDGTEELELECEIPQAEAGQGARVLRGLFDELDIEWRPAEVGKYIRLRRKIGRAPDAVSDRARPEEKEGRAAGNRETGSRGGGRRAKRHGGGSRRAPR
jgi:uncharacterized protein YjbK